MKAFLINNVLVGYSVLPHSSRNKQMAGHISGCVASGWCGRGLGEAPPRVVWSVSPVFASISLGQTKKCCILSRLLQRKSLWQLYLVLFVLLKETLSLCVIVPSFVSFWYIIMWQTVVFSWGIQSKVCVGGEYDRPGFLGLLKRG